MAFSTLLAVAVATAAFDLVKSSSSVTCVTAFKDGYPTVASSFRISNSSWPLNASFEIAGSTHTPQPIWLVDINQHLNSNTASSNYQVYTYEYVIAHPEVATHIHQPQRLNQFAFLLNNVVVDKSVATPTTQVWWGVKYTGCTTITSSDFQAAIWALTQSPGACDLNPAYPTKALCTYGIGVVNTCNVAFLWNLAFANVKDGTNYSVPYISNANPVVYPLVLVPASNQRRSVANVVVKKPATTTNPTTTASAATKMQLVLAVDINSWGVNPRCLNNTCVSAFKQGYPTYSPYFEITDPVQMSAYVYSSLEVSGIIHTDQATFCVDYDQDVTADNLYSDSPVYTYEHVIAHPSVASYIDRPQHLHQVAFLMNNIAVGASKATGAQVWWGKTYKGCTTISASDFQAAVWALVQVAGECDLQPTAANGHVGSLCDNTIAEPNACNVAYLWNLAFANVPNGANYSVSVSYSSRPVVYPLIVSPTFNQTTQIQIVGAVINSWGTSPQCCAVGGYYYAAGSTDALPCRERYYCPNASTPSLIVPPIKCPAGHYCPAGSCTPTLCPCGHKCPEGSSAPITCQPPYYCPSAGASSQTLCPMGHMCPNPGMCAPIPCAPGTYVTCPGKAFCSPCPAGRYCPTATNRSVLCPAGSFCPAGSSAEAACPAGHYCHVGSSAATACPKGSYLPSGGAAYPSACIQCPAGTFQGGSGASACTSCAAGTYQNATGSTACKPCHGAGAGSTACKGHRSLLGAKQPDDPDAAPPAGFSEEGPVQEPPAGPPPAGASPNVADSQPPVEHPLGAGGDSPATDAISASTGAAVGGLGRAEHRAGLERSGEAVVAVVAAKSLPADSAAGYALLTMAVMVGSGLAVRRLFQ